MSTLNSVSELAWRQLFPNPSDEASITKEEFFATAKSEYAYQMWKLSKEERATEGEFQIPSILLSEAELNVSNGRADLSDLKILRSLPSDTWIQNIGGFDCDCRYVRTTVNDHQLLCDDDSIGDDAKTYYVLSSAIVFPNGVHKSPIPITYANAGNNVDMEIQIDDAIAGIIRSRLIEIYAGKTGKEDVTNNTNSTD